MYYEDAQMTDRWLNEGALHLTAEGTTVTLSPYKAAVWTQLTPRERLRRCWAMRARLPNPQAAHDRKLFQGLKTNQIEYLLISGQATVLYGAATFSEDVDVWVNPGRANAERFLAACDPAAPGITS